MKSVFWLLLFAFVVGAAGLIWHSLRKWEARKRAEEERFANFMAGTTGAVQPKDPATLPAPLPAAADGLAQQKLLFESAHKAGEAGEPALAIQLYARLLARYPATTLASSARAAVEAQKKKLLKA
jgi:hypothetical protein